MAFLRAETDLLAKGHIDRPTTGTASHVLIIRALRGWVLGFLSLNPSVAQRGMGSGQAHAVQLLGCLKDARE